MQSSIYAVGDIHGQIDFLEQALDWIAADGGPDAEIVFVGDLVDRGPDSRGVIELLMQGQASGRPWQVIRGNHDRMFARFLSEGIIHDARIKSGINWLNPRLGGITTLQSYGVSNPEEARLERTLAEAREAVPQKHLDYLKGLPFYVERSDKLFVHAGIVPGVALEEQDDEDLIWIRDPFLNDTREHPWLVVHGHTAIDMPFHHGNRVNMDGGAGYGRPIYPAVFEGSQCWLLGDGGRIPLVP
ncbi:metallophosphoesterase family protein [Arenibacterium sp. CAU 1754]